MPTAYLVDLPSNISVSFPFPPYESQTVIMQQIVNSVTKAENAMIDCQTGSGKSAAMICAVVAAMRFVRQPATSDNLSQSTTQEACYLDTQKLLSPIIISPPPINTLAAGQPPIVYIMTKTHLQIEQLLSQIRLCNIPGLSVSVLASRNHLCINSRVLSTPDVNGECRKLTQQWTKISPPNAQRNTVCLYRGPNFYAKLDSIMPDKLSSREQFVTSSSNRSSIPDIEDLKTFGRHLSVCPYYFSKFTHKYADIGLCPYSFAVVPEVRKSMNITVRNNIFVFDEAHNVFDVARSGMSWCVSAATLKRCSTFLLERSPQSIASHERSATQGNLVHQLPRIMLSICARLASEAAANCVSNIKQANKFAGEARIVLKVVFHHEMIQFLQTDLDVYEADVTFLSQYLLGESPSSCFQLDFVSPESSHASQNDEIAEYDTCKKLVQSLQHVYKYSSDTALVISINHR